MAYKTPTAAEYLAAHQDDVDVLESGMSLYDFVWAIRLKELRQHPGYPGIEVPDDEWAKQWEAE